MYMRMWLQHLQVATATAGAGEPVQRKGAQSSKSLKRLAFADFCLNVSSSQDLPKFMIKRELVLAATVAKNKTSGRLVMTSWMPGSSIKLSRHGSAGGLHQVSEADPIWQMCMLPTTVHGG